MDLTFNRRQFSKRGRKPVKSAPGPACPVNHQSITNYVSMNKVSDFFKRHKHIRRLTKVAAAGVALDTVILSEQG